MAGLLLWTLDGALFSQPQSIIGRACRNICRQPAQPSAKATAPLVGARWHEVSRSKEHKAKSDNWLQDAPALRANLLSTPTPKVADTQAFGNHINHRLQHALSVQQHFTKPCQCKLRRKRKVRQQKALQEVCNTISLHSSKTVVAYGDAKFSSSSRGLAPTPTCSLRRHLGTTCTVCDVDEFRTSMLCCECHRAMVGMPIPGKLLALQQLTFAI